jgi:hypothetical protein
MPILHCELGNHSWDRPSQRGRVPKNCPDHQPIKHDIKILTFSETKESVEDDKHESNLEHLIPGISEFLAQEKTEELWCEFGEGHSWQRESRRGKKPRCCPTHAPQINSKSTPAVSTARTQDVIAEILKSPRAITCTCPITPDSTAAELRAMTSCTEPYYICSTLDTVRRKLNL